jgi:outer membrane protein assembly factor BamB
MKNLQINSKVAAGFLVGLLLAATNARAQTPAVTAQIFTPPFGYAGRSPEISLQKGEEGIAADGTNYYLIYRYHLLKVDSTWTNVLARNDTPFTGLKGYDHLGAGEYYDGKLYIATESYHGCANVTNQSIFIFDAADLHRISVTVVSNYTSEVSAVTILPRLSAHGVVFVSNFCDDSKLYEFDLSNLSFLGTVPLDGRVPKLQGLAWNGHAIDAVTDSGTNGVVYAIDPNTGHVQKTAFLTFPHGKEAEGCFYRDGQLSILVSSHNRRFNYVYFFSP